MTAKNNMTNNELKTTVAVMSNDMKHLLKEVDTVKGHVKDVKKQVSDSYVTKQEFEPVKKIVYGLVGLLLASVVGAIGALVIK